MHGRSDAAHTVRRTPFGPAMRRILRRSLVPIVATVALCAPEAPMARPRGPLQIIYPENGSTIAGHQVALLVKADPSFCDGYKPRLIVDGKLRHPPAHHLDLFLPKFFFVDLPPGRHEITVAYHGKRGGAACKETVAITTLRPGPLRFTPMDADAYRQLRSSAGPTIAGFSPVAQTGKTALIRTRVDSRERFWVVPREDERKAVDVIDGPPHLLVDTGRSAARGCSASAERYLVTADLAQEKKLGIYFLDATGKSDSLKIDYRAIQDRLFAEGRVPASWARLEKNLRAFGGISILPLPRAGWASEMGRPVLCSDEVAVVPLQVNCIWEGCTPSDLPVYLILHRASRKYELYRPKEAQYDEKFGWMSPDLVVPFEDKVFRIDLEEGTYRIVGEEKTYPLPLLSSLRKGQSARFGGYVMEIREGTVVIHLRYFEPNKPYDPKTGSALGSRLAGVIGAVILPDRLLLKQTLLWPGEAAPILRGWPREYNSRELYYEVGYAAAMK